MVPLVHTLYILLESGHLTKKECWVLDFTHSHIGKALSSEIGSSDSIVQSEEEGTSSPPTKNAAALPTCRKAPKDTTAQKS